MRRVKKPACPDALKPDGSDGAAEREDAIAHYKAPGWESKPGFDFKAYKDKSVGQALAEAFDGNCAYCESKIGVVSPKDIEHYRPKGAIRTKAGQKPPGYYWLAATWENLLPSCPLCNRVNNLELADGTHNKAGKGNWFPLVNEAKRATSVGKEKDERPLLLHPYRDDPTKHLEFVEEGVVRARLGTNGKPSRRGEATIELLGLNRVELAKQRRIRLMSVRAHRKAVIKGEKLVAANPDDEDERRDLEEARAAYEELLMRDRTYLAMVAQIMGISSP
jgi:uncharacterized protein (TIGR02646 family)